VNALGVSSKTIGEVKMPSPAAKKRIKICFIRKDHFSTKSLYTTTLKE